MAASAENRASCPVCGKPVAAGYKPFCSKRCANVDLNRWLKGSYVIAGAPDADADETNEALADRAPPSDAY